MPAGGRVPSPFPSAAAIAAGQLPHLATLSETFKLPLLMPLHLECLRQEIAPTWDDYVAKIERRALSDLIQIPDHDFMSGLQSIRAAKRPGRSGAILEPVFLVAFERAA